MIGAAGNLLSGNPIGSVVTFQVSILVLQSYHAVLQRHRGGPGTCHRARRHVRKATSPYLTGIKPGANLEVNNDPFRNNCRAYFALSSNTFFELPLEFVAAFRSILNRATAASMTSRTLRATKIRWCYAINANGPQKSFRRTKG